MNKESRLEDLCASGKIIGTRLDFHSLEILGLMSSDTCQVTEWVPCRFSSWCRYLKLWSLLGFLLSHLLTTLPYTPVLFLHLGAMLPQIHDHTPLVPLDGLLRTPTHTKFNNTLLTPGCYMAVSSLELQGSWKPRVVPSCHTSCFSEIQ